MKKTMIMVLVALGPAMASASNADLPFDGNAGCNEGPMAQFGQYLGDWRIEDSSLSRETGEWVAGPGARWIFSCLGDGAAIQDFWLPVGGTVGTNLRTFNEKSGVWDIAWAIKGAPGLSNIRAEQNAAGEIVMHYREPLPDPLRRITFYPADENGWRWKMEFKTDAAGDADGWTEVYRIVATPYAP